MRWNAVAGVVAAAMTLLPQALVGQGDGHMDRTEEIRLARSAGPPSVSADAAVWVLEDGRFAKAVEGSNGFACLVVREAGSPGTLAPHCLDPLAVETVLPAFQMEARMSAEGAGPDEIQEAVVQAFESGALTLPSGPAYAYMLSNGQRLGEAGRWKPHFMLYVPYLTNADVGGDPRRPEFPFVGPREGHPLSTLVIVTTEFVDPSQVSDGDSR